MPSVERGGSPPRAGTRPKTDVASSGSCEDHPRARGRDVKCSGRCPSYSTGITPARGDETQSAYGREYARIRITPARGDETSSRTRRAAISTDHPRVRGRDTAVVQMERRHSIGSPPRAGTRRLARVCRYRGITPARGDETHIDAVQRPIRGSPPRAGTRHLGPVPLESSDPDHPRARGRDECPARRYPRRPTDHPRARGRDASSRSMTQMALGSPPRAGTRLLGIIAVHVVVRITPARGDETG